jgi:hypothetical protein
MFDSSGDSRQDSKVFSAHDNRSEVSGVTCQKKAMSGGP